MEITLGSARCLVSVLVGGSLLGLVSGIICGLGLLLEMTRGSGRCLVSSVGFGIGIGLNCFGT